ncbi:protein FAM207A-like isoform X2 [Centrocercus urophasianus]|uniref:protein FAM207A-like isoform X2 n=1 Tax=Centrocercus urophasianus TaxID=9002 RepID=UPI001C652CC9|nr:protein FAM207A-like isoform X2 [Centrocercus urophasianus]
MVGKVRRPRLHGAAPRPPLRPDPAPPGPGGRTASAAKDWDFSSSDIFSGLTIDPDSLVKKLDLDTRSIVSSKTDLYRAEWCLRGTLTLTDGMGSLSR